MSLFILYFIISIISQKCICQSCKVSENFCNKCNPLTNLCRKCLFDILTPDNNGGCTGIQKCTLGKNYCDECDILGELCSKCTNGYYPDKNGGCSFTENCKISNKGQCLECDNDYILIGKDLELKYCKYLDIEDFKNCKEIDKETGLCQACEDGYFLNIGDKKCTKTQNCNESIYGNCVSCTTGYYLNKKNSTCLLKNYNFLYCKQSLDGKNCDICDDTSYLDQNGTCALSNHCSYSINGKCQKCISNYYLSQYDSICSTEKFCYKADKDTGLCTECQKDYYLDTKDYKCKSNREENDFKYCKTVVDSQCIGCIQDYKLSNDSKCTFSYNCVEAENGKCILCENNYYLGLDNKCTNIKHCIYSNNYGDCKECEDNYYYDALNKTCYKATDNFENCKYSKGIKCDECKNNFYLNLANNTCVDNSKIGPFYKCARSDENNKICIRCIENYYLGFEDNKCSLINYCKFSQDENTCIECDEYHCLDLKKGICVDNDIIYDENIKFYFACNKTNLEGNACAECFDGYEVGENGYCVDVSRCSEEKDGKCIKCTDELNDYGFSYCANSVFGCIESYYDNCLRCDNLLDLSKCTECKEGFDAVFYGDCVEHVE